MTSWRPVRTRPHNILTAMRSRRFGKVFVTDLGGLLVLVLDIGCKVSVPKLDMA